MPVELTAKKEAMKMQLLATSKLRDLSTAGSNEYNALVMSMAMDNNCNYGGENGGADKEAGDVVPMLQRKIMSLINAFQLASIEVNAVQVQWIAGVQPSSRPKKT